MSDEEKKITTYAAEQLNRLPLEQRRRIGDIAQGMALANELNKADKGSEVRVESA